MNLYPEDTLTGLEYDKIRELLSGLCRSEMGRAIAAGLQPFSERSQIEERLNETEEFKELEFYDLGFPPHEFPDLREEFEMLAIPENILHTAGFKRIRKCLLAFREIKKFLALHHERFPHLHGLFRELPYEKSIEKALDEVLDEEGQVRPDASPQLVKIHRKLEGKRKEQNRAFQAVLNKLKKRSVLSDIHESVRNGRRVLGILAEYKRQVKGIIHDESESGHTVFMEPSSTVYLNNLVFELEREEVREVHRILRKLTSKIRQDKPLLESYQAALGNIDFIRAKARLAERLRASRPQIAPYPSLKLQQVYHPLLFLLNEKAGKKTVPMDLNLDRESRILIISGPNAGGKSVCLKTLGLVQLMFQSGMLIPADPNSSMGVFRQLFCDIGDTQSLENELSTYSSRLLRMKLFMENGNKDTLFLIDEFGSGTDPGLGGAVAEAVLERLRTTGAIGTITTHYGNLKIYADKTEGVLNGSLAFDKRELKPLYLLQTGKPGSSYTFEIATRIDLPREVIEQARQLADQSNLAFEDLLNAVQREQRELQIKEQEIRNREQQTQAMAAKYERMLNELQKKEKEAQLAVREKQDHLMQSYERQIRELLQELKKARKEDREVSLQKAHKLQNKLARKKKKVQEEVRQLRKETTYREVGGDIEVGDSVKLLVTGQVGEVAQIKKNKITVSFNSLHTTVSSEDLVKVKSQAGAAGKKRKAFQVQESSFDPHLDLRGMRRELAIQELDKFVNQALMNNATFLRIVHGKGSGALRSAVRKQLQNYKAVKEVAGEEDQYGGEGVTLVELG